MGITDYAQKALGDVVYIEFPEQGKVLQKKGKRFFFTCLKKNSKQ